MKKSDIIISLIIGEVVALYFIDLLGSLGLSAKLLTLVTYGLPVIFPILSVFCLWIAYLIGKKYLVIYQLAKFLLVGALATVLDLKPLSIFIEYFAITSGIFFAILKATTFMIATIGKYFIDKFWAFEKKETNNMKGEFVNFFLATLMGLIVNVGVAMIVVASGPRFNLTPEAWGKIAGLTAVLLTFAWNFVAYKFIVFKK